MASFREYSRRAIQPFIGLLLVVCYLFVFLPLHKRAEELDQPVDKAWRKLAGSVGRTNATSLDFQQIRNQLQETREAQAALSAAEQQAFARFQPSPGLRIRMEEGFRLVDYQNALSQYTDEMVQEAAKRKVQIGPAVFDGFPQHRLDIAEPTLLWASLRMAQDVVDTVMVCGATAIHHLQVSAPFTNAPGSGAGGRWIQVPVEVEFTADASAATRVLQSLPLRHEELKPADLPETSPEKTALLIDNLLIKRQTPESTDEVRVWVRSVGFILRE